MFENVNRFAPWIIAGGVWANFCLAIYGGVQARSINMEFTKALHSVAAIKSDVKALETNMSSFDYLTCVRNRRYPAWLAQGTPEPGVSPGAKEQMIPPRTRSRPPVKAPGRP